MKTLDERRYRRTDPSRFGRAFRGTKRGVRGESTFFVHLFSAAALFVAAASLEASLVEWSILLVCMTIVLAAEMFNMALHRIVAALDEHRQTSLSESLDISQAAVFVTTIGAALVAAIILIYRLSILLGT